MPVSSGVMPLIILSTIGTVDQPGWWPPYYIMGAKIILLVLILFLSFKSLTLLFKSMGSEHEP